MSNSAFDLLGHLLPVHFMNQTGFIEGIKGDGAALPFPWDIIDVKPDDQAFISGETIVHLDNTVYTIGTFTRDIKKGVTTIIHDALEGVLPDAGNSMMYFFAIDDATADLDWYNYTTNPDVIDHANHYPHAICVDKWGHAFITGQFTGEMGYNFGAPESGNLLSVSNGGGYFSLRLDIEADREGALESPVIENKTDSFSKTEDQLLYNNNLKLDFNADEDISVLLIPNPANDNIRILLKDAEIHKRVKLTIYSNDGRIVYESIITSNFENIDISGFSNGIYLVNLKSEKFNLNSKFIKQ